MTQVDATAKAGRIVWVDAARGTSVLLVVVFHVVLWHVSPYFGDLWQPAARLWERSSSLLGGIRIPLLLGVSGMLAGSAIRAGWADRRNLVRAVTNYYLYVVWLLIYGLFFLVLSSPDRLPHRIRQPGELVEQLVLPDTTLWYLLALAVFTVVLASVRAVPGWLQIAVLVAVCVGSRSLDLQDWQTSKVAETAVFFAIGVHLGPFLRRLGGATDIVKLFGAAGLAVVVTLSGRFLDGEVGGSLLFVARGCAFLVFAVLGVAWVARWRPIGEALSALGRHTLPIYVIHPLVIYLVMAVTARGATLPAVLGNPLVALAYPLLVVALACVASLALRWVLRRAGLGLLFELPPVLRARLDRLPRSGH